VAVPTTTRAQLENCRAAACVTVATPHRDDVAAARYPVHDAAAARYPVHDAAAARYPVQTRPCRSRRLRR